MLYRGDVGRMKCLDCPVIITEYIGIKIVVPTDGWCVIETSPVQLCMSCAQFHFDESEIVEWEE